MTEKDIIIVSKLSNLTNQILSVRCSTEINPDIIEKSDSPELNELAEIVVDLAKQYIESYKFIVQLSNGKLNIEPPRRNTFVSSFKQLHSELSHLTWQIKEIAEGDYDQKVSFSGDFSEAINKMILALRERQALADTIKENEYLFRSIFDTSPDGMFICDLEYNILNMSNSARKMLQLTDDDLNTNYIHLIEENDKELGRWFFNELESGNNSAFTEIKLVRKDGTAFWNEQNAGVINDSKGFPKGFFVIIRDISRRKADEEQILKFTFDLKESNSTKDKLFSIIAHDLKNPFHAILGFSDILLKELSSEKINFEETNKYAQIVNESAKRGYDLLINLLEWARIQSGKIKPVIDTLSLLDIIIYNIKGTNSNALSKNISVQYPENKDYIINSDKDLLDAILRNLINNAIKFTPNFGEITISVKQIERFLFISITDSGIGISEENKKKLFRTDVMYSTLGTNNEGGTGLGLILCKEFVNKLGGDIFVESVDGQGTTFTFTIPIQ